MEKKKQEQVKKNEEEARKQREEMQRKEKEDLQNAQKNEEWQQLETEDGTKYWFNSVTQQSQWDDPHAMSSNDLAEPEEWEELLTEDGQQYWYNHKTQDTTWDNPFEEHHSEGRKRGLAKAPAAKPELKKKLDQLNKSLPPPPATKSTWEIAYSDEGQMYWYNLETNETTWDNPGV